MSTQTVFKTAGSTSQTIDVALVQKAAATSPGDPITGLAFNTSSLTAYYRKGATGSATAITLATQTVGGAYSSGGFVEVSSTNAPGLYRFDIPDTVIATAGIASVTFNGAANMATHTVYFIVTAVDLYDSVRGGMTALPNAAAAASGGLFTRGTGAGQINQDANGRIDVNQVAAGGTAGTYASGIPAVSLTSAEETAIANKVWDTACSAHVTAGSFGQALGSTASGTAQAGASTTITLAAGASAVNDFYKYQIIVITAGTGAGQGNIISGYVGATKVATVTAWATNPDATSVYVIIPFGAVPGASAPTAAQNAAAVWDEARASHVSAGSFGQYFAQVFRSGTAQAGTSGSITLDSGASSTNDLYKYSIISIVGGTGAGQSRECNGYTGSSKVATVALNWTVTPSSDSVFLITPFGVDAATIAAIAAGVWDEPRASHGTAGTYGEYTPADATRIAGNATAASNAKNAFDGATGYTFTNSVMPSVTTVTGNVNGNVGGSVASVTGLTASDVGAIKTKTDFLPSATAGAAGGVFIAGSNAATSITTALTANITGNVTGSLSGSVGSVTGAVGSVTGAVGSVTGNVGGSVGSLAAQAQTDVKTQAVAALATDTYAEPSSVPAAASSLKDKIAWLFTLNRNKSTQTATTRALRNDADSGNIATATVSDDGTTATRAEWS